MSFVSLRVPSPCLGVGSSLGAEQEAGTALVALPCGGTKLPVCFRVIFVNYVFTQLAQSYLITQLGRICNPVTMFNYDTLSMSGSSCRAVAQGERVELCVPTPAHGAPVPFVWDPF